MSAICLYFQVHQPRRLKRFQAFDIGQNVDYFADYEDGARVNNPDVLRKVAQKSYLPTNSLILKLLQDYPEMRITYSFSGSFLEQLEEHMPELLASFQEIVNTRQVEILGETYYHSMAGAFHIAEFREQVHLHQEKIGALFGVETTVFRNPNLEFHSQIAEAVKDMGFKAILIESDSPTFSGVSPNHIYELPSVGGISVLIRNDQLSEDIVARFSNNEWDSFPLTADKFSGWLNLMQDEAEVINLYLDYETFGLKHSKESGIFEFMEALPANVLQNPHHHFTSPNHVLNALQAQPFGQLGEYGEENLAQKQLTDWLDNDMQRDSINKLYSLRDRVMATGNHDLIKTWRHLQTGDHLRFMSTDKTNSHKFNPFESPYTAFLSFMNILQDFELQLTELESRAANIN